MRTPESVRAKAAHQFATCIDFEVRCERDATKAREDEELGMRIVDAALALPAGALFILREMFPADQPMEEIFPRAWRVMPFICGSLRLLDIEFANPDVGVVPHAVVCQLMKPDAVVTHEGVELTGNNVFLQYRRMAL